jgi:uncharacterized protein
MIHPDTELRFIDGHSGYGVFATRSIPLGTVVWVQCALDRVITPAQRATLATVYHAIVDKYSYIDGNGDFILCWDHARYINHSCRPAMLSLGQHAEIAVRDIAAGDELTCDYGVLNLQSPLACACGDAQCRGTIAANDLLAIASRIDGDVRATLRLAGKVDQPLIAYLSDRRDVDNWLCGREPPPSVVESYCARR